MRLGYRGVGGVGCRPTGLLSRVLSCSVATGDCALMLLTTAMPSSARDSRLHVNHHGAGNERKGDRGE